MADAPRLPTTNEPTGYAPYAVTAILAVILTAVFVLLLGVLGLLAFIGGQQLVEPLLLVLPVGILVLSFAARRQILNSEGTRAGLPFCNFAWWVAVLGGAGYAAYLGGRLIGVQSDTKDALTTWMATLQKGDPVDPRNIDFHRAYQKTLETGRQASVEVKADNKSTARQDIEAAQKGFQEDTPGMIGVVHFRQSDLVRALYRSGPFEPKFTFDGLQTWDQDSSGLRAKSAGTLTTPEGTFKLNFDMMRQTPPDSRPVWRVVAPPQGFISGAKFTRYGQQLMEMDAVGRSFVYDVLLPLFGKDDRLMTFRPLILQEANKPDFARYEYMKQQHARAAVIGGAAGLPQEPPGYETQLKSQFFVPLDRADVGRDGDPRERFYATWRDGRIVRPGVILTDNPDQAPLMGVTEKAVELRVPVELQPPQLEASQSAARGAVVLVCDDAAYVDKLNELRKAAATDPLLDPVAPKADARVPWQVRRIESDMKLVKIARKDAPQGDAMQSMPLPSRQP